MKNSPSSGPAPVLVRETPIELSQLMKFAGLSGSGGEAKQAIADGLVQVNGAVETRKGKKLVAGDRVTYEGKTVIIQIG